MSPPVRVRHLHITAADRRAVPRAAALAEDALHTAALPRGRPGWLLVIRRLELGEVAIDRPAQVLAMRIEARVAELVARAVSADSPGARDALSVWFREPAEARALLVERLVEGPPPVEWFWRAAVPEWRPGVPVETVLAAVTTAAPPRHGEPPPIVQRARFVEVLLRRGSALAVLRRLPARSWAVVTPRRAPTPGIAVAVPSHWRPLLATLVEEWGPEDPRVIVLAAAAIVVLRPELAASPELAALASSVVAATAPRRAPMPTAAAEVLPPVKVTLADAPQPPATAPVAEPTTEGPASPRRAAPAAPPPGALPVEARPPAIPPVVPSRRPPPVADPVAAPRPPPAAIAAEVPDFIDESTVVPPTAEPARVPARPAPAAPMAFAPAAPRPSVEPRWMPAGVPDLDGLRPTVWGGLFFLVAPLQRLGLPAAPEQLAGGFGWSILAEVLGDAEDEDALRAFVATLLPEERPDRDAARAWVERLRAWCGEDLELEGIVRRPALFAATRTHIDVILPLSAAQIEVRRRALDADPGWVPWLGRVIAFHYVENDDFRRIGLLAA